MRSVLALLVSFTIGLRHPDLRLTAQAGQGKSLTLKRTSGEAFGLRQPAAAFLSQPAGAKSFGVPKQSDLGVWRRLALSDEGRPSYSPPAGWLGKATAGCSTPRPSAGSLEFPAGQVVCDYRAELAACRAAHGGSYDVPDVKFFLFASARDEVGDVLVAG